MDKVERCLYYIVEPGKKPRWNTEVDDYPYSDYYELLFTSYPDGTIEYRMFCPYEAETLASMKDRMLVEIEKHLNTYTARIASLQLSVRRSLKSRMRKRDAANEKGRNDA